MSFDLMPSEAPMMTLIRPIQICCLTSPSSSSPASPSSAYGYRRPSPSTTRLEPGRIAHQVICSRPTPMEALPIDLSRFPTDRHRKTSSSHSIFIDGWVFRRLLSRARLLHFLWSEHSMLQCHALWTSAILPSLASAHLASLGQKLSAPTNHLSLRPSRRLDWDDYGTRRAEDWIVAVRAPQTAFTRTVKCFYPPHPFFLLGRSPFD